MRTIICTIICTKLTTKNVFYSIVVKVEKMPHFGEDNELADAQNATNVFFRDSGFILDVVP